MGFRRFARMFLIARARAQQQLNMSTWHARSQNGPSRLQSGAAWSPEAVMFRTMAGFPKPACVRTPLHAVGDH